MKHITSVQTAASSDDIAPPASEAGVVTSSHSLSVCVCVCVCVRARARATWAHNVLAVQQRVNQLQLSLPGGRRSALCEDGERINGARRSHIKAGDQRGGR